MIKKNKGVLVFLLSVILAIIFATILQSCSSRKVIIDKSIVKSDSISITKDTVSIKTIDSSYVKKEVSFEETIIKPIDSCSEFIVNGKLYKNVIITVKKHKDNNLYSKSKTLDLRASKTQIKAIKKEVVAKKKEVIKKSNANNYFIFFMVLIILLFCIYKYITKINILKRLG